MKSMLCVSSPLVFFLQMLGLTLLAHGLSHSQPDIVKAPIEAVSKLAKSLVGDDAKPSLDSLKRSVFRITVYSKVWRWSRPYDDNYVVGSLGSGFLVGDNPMTIVTCAHVVRGAHKVYLQVTEFGKTKFEANVDIINNEADVAVLSIKKPDELIAMLAKADMKLVPLKIAEKTPLIGHEVTAPGFPLGQETMTLSTGIISGVDHVSFHYTNLAIQSTAIISSGNSGSPLLDQKTLEVIGMNYAKKPSEAQINYVVGLWRVKQVLAKHKKMLSDKKKSDDIYQFRLPKAGLTLTPGVNALYMLSEGSTTCQSGPLISSIAPTSPFHDADPAIPANSFLVSVDGVTLDNFGQGTKKEYVNELVDFNDLMWMRGGTGEEEISFETCNAATGKPQKHKMSMAWDENREGKGIQYSYDPRLDKVDWEIYGDLLFTPLTENHISLFSGDYSEDAMIRFLAPENRMKPKLAVMLLKGGGEAQDALDLSKGSDLEIVESINGHEVNSLEDFRKHFFPDPRKKAKTKDAVKLMNVNSSLSKQSFLHRELQKVQDGEELIWSLKTATGKEFASLFVDVLKKQATSGKYSTYLMTPAAKTAMGDLGLIPGSKKKTIYLLATPPDNSAASLNEDDSVQMRGEPLELIRREGHVGILDFAPHEGLDSW